MRAESTRMWKIEGIRLTAHGIGKKADGGRKKNTSFRIQLTAANGHSLRYAQCPLRYALAIRNPKSNNSDFRIHEVCHLS